MDDKLFQDAKRPHLLVRSNIFNIKFFRFAHSRCQSISNIQSVSNYGSAVNAELKNYFSDFPLNSVGFY